MTTAASMSDITAICEQIKQNYSPCDISDALLTLKITGAGHLADIHPIPSILLRMNRIVAPVSTVLFTYKDHNPRRPRHINPTMVPEKSNLPSDKHWTDVAPSGSVVIMQQPDEEVTAGLVGDIVSSRYKTRGIVGAVVDGRTRDVPSIGKMCEDGNFSAWTKKLTSVGTGLQAKPWAVDVPLKIGMVIVNPGDILCADEAEQVITVIPKEKLQQVMIILPKLKAADDEVLRDAQTGVDLKTSFAAHPDHYTHFH